MRQHVTFLPLAPNVCCLLSLPLCPARENKLDLAVPAAAREGSTRVVGADLHSHTRHRAPGRATSRRSDRLPDRIRRLKSLTRLFKVWSASRTAIPTETRNGHIHRGIWFHRVITTRRFIASSGLETPSARWSKVRFRVSETWKRCACDYGSAGNWKTLRRFRRRKNKAMLSVISRTARPCRR